MRVASKSAAGGRGGASLVMVGLAISVLASLSVAMVVTTRAASAEKSAQREEVAALFAAEAGLSEAVFALNTGGTGAVGNQRQPLEANGSLYWVEVNDLPNGMKALTSTGVDNRAGMRIELTVQEDQNNLWVWGAFGDEALTMDSNSHVDSFDSTLGTYDSQQVNGSGSTAYALSNGHVGSNGGVDMKQNSVVNGNAVPGPSSAANVTGNAVVTGSTAPNSGKVALPEMIVPSFDETPGELAVDGSTPITMASGDYEYSDLFLGQNAELTIVGPARIVVDNMELSSNSQIVVDATGGPVEFFVHDDFILNSNTLIASTTFTPSDVSINLESDNVINPEENVQIAEVLFESNSSIYGTIFAPNAMIDIDSNFELFGSVVARQVHLDGWARVHFDEALMNVVNQNVAADWQAVCWRKLAFKP